MHRKSSVPFGSVIKAFLFIIVNILQNFQKFLHDNWSYFQIIANEGQVGFWRKYNTKIQHVSLLSPFICRCLPSVVITIKIILNQQKCYNQWILILFKHSPLETRGKLSSVNFHKDLRDRYWGCASQLLPIFSPVPSHCPRCLCKS